jgi:glycosyltransferase involved in cell wall biosynthesis
VKLIIQIPSFNEEEQLPATLVDLPRAVPGFDKVEWLVIDDGSRDRTVEVAKAGGVDHIVKLTKNSGLATGFQAGLDAALKLGADVIVNTDADNQYPGAAIADLVAPIIAGHAEMVVGDRQVETIAHFSPLKKRLQHLGSWVVRQVSGTDVLDATSGFRAYNREAALRMQVVSGFTYTLETLIQAGNQSIAVDNVPIVTNPKTRESRLFGSMWGYVRRNALSIFRIYSQYQPLRVFWGLATLIGAFAFVLFIRYAVLVAEHGYQGVHAHNQTLTIASIAFNAAMLFGALGVISDLLSAQRTLLQRTFERVRRIELKLGVEPSNYEPGHSEPPQDHGEPAPDGTPQGELLPDGQQQDEQDGYKQDGCDQGPYEQQDYEQLAGRH